MKPSREIAKLWDEFESYIDNAYVAGVENCDAIRDYSNEHSYGRQLKELLALETQNERQHRRGFRPDGWRARISSDAAAKLMIMQNAAEGMRMKKMPSAIEFITFRKTAAESRLVGFIIRSQHRFQWMHDLEQLDYAQLMK